MTRPRLLFYCQHSVGLGHLVRSVHLAEGLARDFDVTLLNGGPWPVDLPQPSAIDIVHLPALGLDEDYTLISRDERFTVDEAVGLRRSMIQQCFRDTAPDVVLIELFPFGRKKFRGELMPLLEAARAADPPPFVACSLRDILVGSRRDQQGHDDRASQVANEYFDAVLVHADARFATLEETFHPNVPLRVPVHYTGFVRAPVRRDDGAGARAAGPRVGRRRAGRRAAVPRCRRRAPAPPGRPRPAHRDRDRSVPPRPGRRGAHPPGGGDHRAGGGALPPRPRRRDGRLGRVRQPGRLQHHDGHPRLHDARRRRAVRRGTRGRAGRPRPTGSRGSARCASSTRTGSRGTPSRRPWATPSTGLPCPSRSRSTDAPARRSCCGR